MVEKKKRNDSESRHAVRPALPTSFAAALDLGQNDVCGHCLRGEASASGWESNTIAKCRFCGYTSPGYDVAGPDLSWDGGEINNAFSQISIY